MRNLGIRPVALFSIPELSWVAILLRPELHYKRKCGEKQGCFIQSIFLGGMAFLRTLGVVLNEAKYSKSIR